MWTIQLLGGLAVAGSQQVVTRFRTQKAASLLAYLAFHATPGAPARSRDSLLELLWPEADLDAGRHNLSNALSVVRRVLEPTGVAPGAVVLADHSAVRLNPAAVRTDVTAFEEAVASAADLGLPAAERERLLLAAPAAAGRNGGAGEWKSGGASPARPQRAPAGQRLRPVDDHALL